MARTPERSRGRALEQAAVYKPTLAATEQGEVRYTGSRFSLFDSAGEYDPRSGGGGITEAQHEALRDLIHFISEGPAEGFSSGAFKEVLGGFFPTTIIWWESSAKLQKIVEKTITRPTLIKPTPIVWQMYATDGTTVLATVTDVITYSGIREVSRTRTIA